MYTFSPAAVCPKCLKDHLRTPFCEKFSGGACPWTPLEAHTLQALAVHPLPTLKIWLTTSKSMENTGCTLYVVAKTKSLHRAISETS